MATYEEVVEALEDAIVKVTKKTDQNTTAAAIEHYASAARALAEARAWLIAPAQPHGGSGSVSVSVGKS